MKCTVIGSFIYLIEVKWKTIIFNGVKTNYEVSNIGEVRNALTKRILSPYEDRDGYLHVSIIVNGKQYHRGVHRYVANAFIKNPHNKPEVNHINGNKKDNVVLNLEWVTTSENVRHAFRTGLKFSKLGSANTLSHYTDVQIKTVCSLLEKGIPNIKISKITGVNRKYITDIKKGKRWKHISKGYNIQKEKYPKELKKQIEQLVLQGYTTTEIINSLNLDVIDKYRSLINRIQNLVKLSASTTIPNGSTTGS